MATTTDVAICSRALILLGQDAITTLSAAPGSDDESDNVETCATLYPGFKAEVFGKHPWRWAKAKAQLSQDAVSPVNKWTYRYIYPPASERLIAVFDSSAVGARPITAYERLGAYIHSDASALWAEYVELRGESTWPGSFEAFVVAGFAARIAIAVTGTRSMAEHWHQVAYGLPAERGEGGLYAQAKYADSSESPPNQVADFTLIEARFGSVDYGLLR